MSRLLYFSTCPARLHALSEVLAGLLPSLPDTTANTLNSWSEVESLVPLSGDVVLLDLEDQVIPPQLPASRLILRTRELAQKGEFVRPLRWEELRMRLLTLLERRDEEEEFAVGPYLCAPIDRVLLTEEGEEKTRLTEKEITLLRTLAEAGPEGVSRADLLEKVWGYRNDLETHTLETHIYRLRQKLEVDPLAPRLLLTLESGYALSPAPDTEDNT